MGCYPAKPRLLDAVASGSTSNKQMSEGFHAADAALNDLIDRAPAAVCRRKWKVCGGLRKRRYHRGSGRWQSEIQDADSQMRPGLIKIKSRKRDSLQKGGC